MNEIRLFSVRRVVMLSLVFGLFALVVIGQALENPDSGDNEINSNNQSSSTQTTSSSTTTQSSNSTQTNTTQFDTSATTSMTAVVSTTETREETEGVSQSGPGDFAPYYTETLETKDEDAGIRGPSLSKAVDVIRNLVVFSVGYLLVSAMFFLGFSGFYLFIFNNGELTDYINQSLKQAGFDDSIASIGKKWNFQIADNRFSMRLFGIRTLRMKIELPRQETIDPREFGLGRLENLAITLCDLDVLPLRLRVVKMYLDQLD